MARDWSMLPDTALVSILSNVELPARLESCALVHSSWAAAAVVATQEMQLSSCPDPANITKHLSSSFGSSLRSLQIDTGPKQLLSKFPALPNLEELQLLQVVVQLGPGCGERGILQSVTSLTHLLLREATVVAGLHAITVLRALRSLSVTDCMQSSCRTILQDDLSTAHASTAAGNDADTAAAATEGMEALSVPGSLVSQLVQLTYLELRGGLCEASVQDISMLTNLDSLAVDFEGSEATPAAIRGLERLQGLSFLALTDSDIPLSAATVPGLSRLHGLEALWLYNCRSIDPLLLAPLTKLQQLDLDSTPPAGGAKGTAALLAVLPKLQHLTHLDLCDCLTDSPAAPAAAYAALTASRQLAYLDIQGACLPEPAGEAWGCLLPRGRVMQGLQRLHLAGMSCGPRAMYIAGLEDYGLSTEQLQDLVECYPGLQHLQCSLLQGNLPTPLLQLTALSALALQGVSEEVASEVLLRLPSLQELHIVPDSSIDETGLLQLTALTQLSQLGLHHEGCGVHFVSAYGAQAVKDGEDLVLMFEEEAHPPGTPCDVWLQLLRCCVASPKCRPLLPSVLHSLTDELVSAQQQQALQLLLHPDGSSSSRWMVEEGLRAAGLQQQARMMELVVQNLRSAVEMVAGAVEGSGTSSSSC